MTSPSGAPIRVLFLCTHNSARSQMAEAFLRRYGGDRFDVYSAGTEPVARVNPLAEAAMGLLNMSLAGQYPKHLRQYIDQPWDYIITTCDAANEACPAFPDDPTRIHWGFPDPAAAIDTEEERLRAFRRVRDEIKRRVQFFVELPVHQRGAGRGVGSGAWAV